MNRLSENLHFLVATCLVACLLSIGPAGAVASTNWFANPHPAAAVASASPVVDPSKMSDGCGFLNTLATSVHKWKDYSCETHLEVFRPEKTTKTTCHFFFKAPMVRIEITDGGFRSGSVLVRQPDGAIKAKGGLMMGFITMNLDPDSRILQLPTGHNVLKTDLPNVVDELKDIIAHGGSAKVSNSPVKDDLSSLQVFVVEFYESARSPAPLSKRLFVDAGTNLPVRIDSFKDSKLFSVAQFKHIRPNAGLADDMFKL